MCGSNLYGQMGIPSEQTTVVTLPMRVEGLKGKKITQLVMGGAHTLALTSMFRICATNAGFTICVSPTMLIRDY